MINKISFIKFIVLASMVPTLYFCFNPGEIVIPTLLTMYPSLLLVLVLIFTERITLMDEKKKVLMFFFYGAFTFARGLYDAKSFQDWTNLLSISVSTFIFSPPDYLFGRTQKICWTIHPHFVDCYSYDFYLNSWSETMQGLMVLSRPCQPLFLSF